MAEDVKKPELPAAINRKYEALITPTVIHVRTENGSRKTIDLTRISAEDAEWLVKNRKDQYLKLRTKELAEGK